MYGFRFHMTRIAAIALFFLLPNSAQELPKRLVFAWVSNNDLFASQLTLQNQGQGQTSIQLTATRGDGSQAQATRSIPGLGSLSEAAETLFPSLGKGSGYSVLVSSETSLLDGRVLTFNRRSGSGASPGAANAIRLAERFLSTSILSSDALNLGYFPIDSQFFSAPAILNIGDQATDITLRAYTADGSLVMEDKHSATALPPFQPFTLLVSEFLGGYAPGVTLTASSSGQPLTGVGFIFNQVGEPAISNATALRPPLPEASQIFSYDFTQGQQEWQGSFSDYPVGEDSFYELAAGLQSLPEALGAASAFYISGNNHSDDLCMFLYKKVEGLQPNTNYAIEWQLSFASNGIEGCIGVGGSPGDSVYLKAGAIASEPTRVNFEGYWRAGFDKGNQASGGKDVAVLGTVGVPGDCGEESFALKSIQSSMPTEVKSDAQGQAWLIVASDSGFEATTSLYFTSIQARFSLR